MLPESIKSLIKSQCRKILIVWNNVDANYLQKIAEEIKSLGKVDLKLNFEHFPLLKLTNFRKSSFDMIITGFPIDFPSIDDSQNFFFDSIDYLRQNGSIFVFDKLENRAKIEKSMKLSGLIDIETEVDGNKEIDAIVYSARSPPFELGALSTLSLTTGDHEAAAPATVWRLDQDDLIDTDALLEPADLARPSTVTMDAGACGATAKRACKNCTCGLAEELAATEKEKTVTEDDKPVRSACGNCYLGDGFRCSGCPYLGMPPFRPGERVLLVDSDDIDL